MSVRKIDRVPIQEKRERRVEGGKGNFGKFFGLKKSGEVEGKIVSIGEIEEKRVKTDESKDAIQIFGMTDPNVFQKKIEYFKKKVKKMDTRKVRENLKFEEKGAKGIQRRFGGKFNRMEHQNRQQ
jgi:hypothetical protein